MTSKKTETASDRAKKKYQREKRFSKTIVFNKETEKDLIDFAKQYKSFSAFVKDALKKEMKKQKKEMEKQNN